ncbi:MAG: transglycosylase domain-containing protein, partial [Vicinamibacterales bacterium]
MPLLPTPRTLLRTLLIALSIAAGAALYSIWQIRQDVDRVAARFTLDPGPQSTLIFDSKDHLISALYKEHRIPVTREEMSDPLVHAVIATEDRRFYDHHGVDSRRIGAALVANLRRGRIVQGGSTITQQFVRGAFLDRSRTYSRKVREAWLAYRLESKFSKRAILQAYLNHVYFGDGYYGVHAASLGYFGKPASAITATEAATLAALINRPSGYGIRRTPAKVRDRRDWVLRQMHQQGYLDANAYGEAIATPVVATLAPANVRAEIDPIGISHGPYFASMVHE